MSDLSKEQTEYLLKLASTISEALHLQSDWEKSPAEAFNEIVKELRKRGIEIGGDVD